MTSRCFGLQNQPHAFSNKEIELSLGDPQPNCLRHNALRESETHSPNHRYNRHTTNAGAVFALKIT